MNDKANFNELMSSVFQGHWSPVRLDDESNNIIGALSNEEFKFFKDHFMNMINELISCYEDDPREMENLVKTVRDLATKSGCYGAYSELCVLHVLSIGGFFDVSTNQTLPASESYAANLGHTQDTNMDGCIEDFDIFFDTKSFRDTITPILNNVTFKSTQRLFRAGLLPEDHRKRLHIQYQFSLCDTEEVYKGRISDLIDEFFMKFKEEIVRFSYEYNRIKGINSDLIPGLRYIFNWGGVTSAESSYSPYERAEKLVEPLLVRYTDKFLIHHPFMLVLVNHPWFNQVDTGSFGFNKVLYRSLSRRVFMQFRYDSRKMSEINNDFKGDELIDDISKHISAILYIDVFSAVDKGVPYKCYLYTNPRAINKIHAEAIYHTIQNKKLLDELDDFRHDNY